MKMAKEGRLRKLHRRDWPGFLNRMVPAGVWQRFAAAIPRSTDPRIRWSPKYALLCWVVMGWSVQGELTERFREGYETLAGLFPRRARCGTRYQGLTQATQRLGPSLFGRFWGCLRSTFPARLGALWKWHGWIVMAVDGSRVLAPRTRRNEQRLGHCGRDKSHPQWWVTWTIHLPSHLVWDWRLGPGDSSERAHLRQMLPSLPAGTLLVADTGFGGFDLLSQLLRNRVDFLIRCGSNSTLLLKDAHPTRVRRCGDYHYVYLWPLNRRRRRPLKLRLIVLKRGGQSVYLLTNVWDSQRLSRATAGEIYKARWGIEVTYRGLKQTLGRRKVLARTPEPGEMELAGNILAIALLMLHAALALGPRVLRASVAGLLKVIRQAIEQVRHQGSTAAVLVLLRAAVRDDYQRHRSKRARDWPHKKHEQPAGPPKLRRLKVDEKTLLEARLNEATTNLG